MHIGSGFKVHGSGLGSSEVRISQYRFNYSIKNLRTYLEIILIGKNVTFEPLNLEP
jgi:hypothetical protein